MNNGELENLYEKYYLKVYSFLKKLSRSNNIAEDLTQETFVLALLKLPGETEYMLSWLYKVAKNLYIDWVRKSGREIFDDQLELKSKSIENDPLADILRKEKQEILHYKINELSLIERKMILYFYFKELSTREIAALLGVSAGSVRVTLHRARTKLLRKLKEEG